MDFTRDTGSLIFRRAYHVSAGWRDGVLLTLLVSLDALDALDTLARDAGVGSEWIPPAERQRRMISAMESCEVSFAFSRAFRWAYVRPTLARERTKPVRRFLSFTGRQSGRISQVPIRQLPLRCGFDFFATKPTC